MYLLYSESVVLSMLDCGENREETVKKRWKSLAFFQVFAVFYAGFAARHSILCCDHCETTVGKRGYRRMVPTIPPLFLHCSSTVPPLFLHCFSTVSRPLIRSRTPDPYSGVFTYTLLGSMVQTTIGYSGVFIHTLFYSVCDSLISYSGVFVCTVL
jgi:hypothetical protein